jgi:hypothetical protein
VAKQIEEMSIKTLSNLAHPLHTGWLLKCLPKRQNATVTGMVITRDQNAMSRSKGSHENQAITGMSG